LSFHSYRTPTTLVNSLSRAAQLKVLSSSGWAASTMIAMMKQHWEHVYRTKPTTQVSWYQAEPKLSLELIRCVAEKHWRIIDIGGGASVLVDRLLVVGFGHVAVLDIAGAALDAAKRRLGERSRLVEWLEADITAAAELGPRDLWHDRAVFHFLTSAAERRRYVKAVTRTVLAGGYVIIATFALDGPSRCSGLDVQRWDGKSIAGELESAFELVREAAENHVTPQGKEQHFIYACFRRITRPR
jgi:SAM-dependent methyltransferase